MVPFNLAQSNYIYSIWSLMFFIVELCVVLSREWELGEKFWDLISSWSDNVACLLCHPKLCFSFPGEILLTNYEWQGNM